MNYKIALMIAAVGVIMWISAAISQMRNDNMRINATLNKIARKVGAFDELTTELKKLISEHETIKAIRLYRKATESGLVEAKEYIDSLKEELKIGE